MSPAGRIHCSAHYTVERCDTTSGRNENPSCNYSQSFFFSSTSRGPFSASHSPYVHSLTIFFSVKYSPSHSLVWQAVISDMLFSHWINGELFSCPLICSNLTVYKRTWQPLYISCRSFAFCCCELSLKNCTKMYYSSIISFI